MTEFTPSVLEKIISDVTIISVGIRIRSIETFSHYDDTSTTIIPLHIFPEQITSWNNNQRFVRLIGVIKPQILVLLKKYTDVLPVLFVISHCIYHPLRISTLIPKTALELDVWDVFLIHTELETITLSDIFWQLWLVSGVFYTVNMEWWCFAWYWCFFQKYLLK